MPELETHLRSEDFFDVKRYPEIRFKSERLTFKQDKLILVTGLLTLHGQSKPLSLVVNHYHCGVHSKALKYVCGANTTGMIKRSDFSVDKYAPVLADEVKLMIQVESIRQ